MASYFRKVIKIRAEDTPNVQYALAELKEGQQPSGKVLVPGLLTYEEYVKRRLIWDTMRQTIGLDAEFYEGAEVRLYPPLWLTKATHRARGLVGQPRQALSMACDSAEGGDNTTFAIGDDLGLIELVSFKTKDTTEVVDHAIVLGRDFNVDPHRWTFDRAGGGKEHADRLRKLGYNVQTFAFGDTPTPESGRFFKTEEQVRKEKEEKSLYFNRRAQVYWWLRMGIDPTGPIKWALPDWNPTLAELHRQLGLMPKQHDGEGRFRMPPKHRRKPNSTEKTLTQIIGHSPDEADAVVILYYDLARPIRYLTAGVIE